MPISDGIRKGLAAALALTFVVVVVGAFVRLSDAGLGCPDWPGCYGELLGIADLERAQSRYPDSDYDARKAWIEVGHRYIAGGLGLLLLALAAADWRRRRRWALPQWVVVAVAAQAALGMLTVTQLLKPAIVVAHLLGGMFILFLLALAVTKKPLSAPSDSSLLKFIAAIAAVLLFAQIALGGWVSANYAGLACPDFPVCHGEWTPPTVDFSGFDLARDLRRGSDGGAITAAALATIHWAHRLGALALAVWFAVFVVALWRGGNRREGGGLAAALIAQILVGILNIAYQLPLSLAILHNALAAMLVVNVAVLLAKMWRDGYNSETWDFIR